jgi:hypothetical protein
LKEKEEEKKQAKHFSHFLEAKMSVAPQNSSILFSLRSDAFSSHRFMSRRFAEIDIFPRMLPLQKSIAQQHLRSISHNNG